MLISDLLTLDLVYNGQPFAWLPAHESIDLLTMDWVYDGQPFISPIEGEEPPPPPPPDTAGSLLLLKVK